VPPLPTLEAACATNEIASASAFADLFPSFSDVLKQVANVESLSNADRRRFDNVYALYDRVLRTADIRLPLPTISDYFDFAPPLPPAAAVSRTSSEEQGTTTVPTPVPTAAETPPPRVLPKVSVSLFERLLSIDRCNTFGFWALNPKTNHLWSRGVGTLPASALFNHTCDPNVARVNFGCGVTFVTLSKVTAGTPLGISYIETQSGTRERRKELSDTYKFYCRCPRCAATDATGLEAPLSSECPRCDSCFKGAMIPTAWPVGACLAQYTARLSLNLACLSAHPSATRFVSESCTDSVEDRVVLCRLPRA
jgi:hypothetical protein